MAGPCFTIYYENDTILPKERVRKLLEKLTTIHENIETGCWEFWLDTNLLPGYKTKKGKQQYTGMLLLFQETPFINICDQEKIALAKALGFIPQFSWGACAMCKDDKDIDALYFLIDLLVNAAGGYQKTENIPDRILNDEPDCFYEISFRDYAAYFGPKEKEISAEDKAKYHDFVELKSYYMVDISKTSFSILDY